MSLHVISPGLLTTVQDGGRAGLRHIGIGNAGAADRHSLRLANLLVGNPPEAAAIEITLRGPTLQFTQGAEIAMTGGDIIADVDGTALPAWRPVRLPAGSCLHVRGVRRGCRAYLAIAGGLRIEPMLGSRSADLRGRFGGWQGRPLQAGDCLPIIGREITTLQIARWWIDPRPDLDFDHPALLRLLPGPDATRPADAMFRNAWTVDACSDRQGLRLCGPALDIDDAGQRISSPVLPGAIQRLPDGQPIMLLADAQTIGGYPRIADLATVDMPRAAQLRPGEAVRFVPIDVDTARQRCSEQQHRLERIATAIAARRYSATR